MPEKSVVNSLRRLCQKPARPDAYPPLKCSFGATVCDAFSLSALLSGDTSSYCVAIVSPVRNQRVTLGKTTDDRCSDTHTLPHDGDHRRHAGDGEGRVRGRCATALEPRRGFRGQPWLQYGSAWAQALIGCYRSARVD